MLCINDDCLQGYNYEKTAQQRQKLCCQYYMQDALEVKMHIRLLGSSISLARAARCLVLFSAACVVTGCASRKAVEVVVQPLDTLGPMPLMHHPELLPSPEDTRNRDALARLLEVQDQLVDLAKQSKNEEAMELAKDCLERQKASSGPDSVYTAVAYDLVGQLAVYNSDKQLEEDAWSNVVRIKSAYLGYGCLDTADAVDKLVRCLVGRGKIDQASKILDDDYQLALKQPPSANAEVQYLVTAAWLMQIKGQLVPASSYLDRALQLKKANPAILLLKPTIHDLLAQSAQVDVSRGLYDAATDKMADYMKRHFDRRVEADQLAVQVMTDAAADALSKHQYNRAAELLKDGRAVSRNGYIPVATMDKLGQCERLLSRVPR